MIRLSGVVLAGGRSSRMGTDKAFLTVGDETLIERQLRLLREIGCEEIFISGRAGINYPDAADRVLHDSVADAGPLAGIVAALEAANGSHLLVVAVDLPRLSGKLLRYLLTACTDKNGAVFETRRGLEPLVAIYPVTMAPEGRSALESGSLSVQRWLADAIAGGTVLTVKVDPSDEHEFINWNNPVDFTETTGSM